jgi:hypothetical protein
MQLCWSNTISSSEGIQANLTSVLAVTVSIKRVPLVLLGSSGVLSNMERVLSGTRMLRNGQPDMKKSTCHQTEMYDRPSVFALCDVSPFSHLVEVEFRIS